MIRWIFLRCCSAKSCNTFGFGSGKFIVRNYDLVLGWFSLSGIRTEIVEFTIEGKFVKQISVDPAQRGSFGLAIATSGELPG
jgi:hypothetical protein